jgi:putative sporulation protein YyaC
LKTLWKEDLPVYYFDAAKKSSQREFQEILQKTIDKHKKKNQTVVLICIGSDRATGDCLGPMIGYKLAYYHNYHFAVYGTLDEPVHAKNLEETVSNIKKKYKNPLMIAIDASLGARSHIGYVTLMEGGLQPGIGVNKALPVVGDISITGIVNLSGMVSQMLLQTTPLHTVMQMADFIAQGFFQAFVYPSEFF